MSGDEGVYDDEQPRSDMSSSSAGPGGIQVRL